MVRRRDCIIASSQSDVAPAHGDGQTGAYSTDCALVGCSFVLVSLQGRMSVKHCIKSKQELDATARYCDSCDATQGERRRNRPQQRP